MPNFRMEVGDICDISQLSKVFEKMRIDMIVHAAAIPGLERCRKDPEKAILTNILGTYNVLEVARASNVSKVIFTSSAAVYGVPEVTPIPEDHPLNPRNLYGATKHSGEVLMRLYNRTYGLNTLILRFGNVYGVGVYTYWETVIPRFVKQALTDNPLTIFGDGEQSRDFIHVRDIVKAIKLALRAEADLAYGEVFNVGIGRPTKINDLAKLVSSIVKEETGKEVRTVHLPPRKGEPYIPNFSLQTTKITEKLGFKADWTLEDGIKQLIKYWFSIREV